VYIANAVLVSGTLASLENGFAGRVGELIMVSLVNGFASHGVITKWVCWLWGHWLMGV
jgi:hypothetical protein